MKDLYAAYGAIIDVMARAEPNYPTWRLWEVHAQIAPAVSRRQVKLFHAGEVCIGFATWVWLTEEQGKDYIRTGRPSWDQWKGGDQLWMLDLAALEGFFPQVQRHMAIHWYPGQEVHARRHDGRHVVHTAAARERRRMRALAHSDYEGFRHAGE